MKFEVYRVLVVYGVRRLSEFWVWVTEVLGFLGMGFEGSRVQSNKDLEVRGYRGIGHAV